MNSNIITVLIGFFIWFPSFSILNIGNGTSIQPIVLVSIVFFLLLKSKYLVHRNTLIFFLLWFFILLLQILYSTILSGEGSFYIKGLIFFSLSIFMSYIGYIISRSREKFIGFMKGFLFGGYLSCFLSLIQWSFYNIFHIDFPLISFFHNSASFISIASTTDVISNGRSFVFMAEPSLLFIHLCTFFFVLLTLKGHFVKISMVFLSIFTTASMGVFLVMPIVLLYFISQNFYKLRKIIFLVLIFITSFGSIFIYKSFSLYDSKDLINVGLSYDTNLFSRIVNLSTSVSFLSRFNSMLSGTKMMAERPITGWGVQSDKGKIFLENNSMSIEENIGINSYLFSILAWFGLGALYVLYLVTKTTMPYTENKLIKVKQMFIFSGFIGASFSLSYYNVYFIWIIMGMTLTKTNFIRENNAKIISS